MPIGCKCRAVSSPSVPGAVTTTSDVMAANAVTLITAEDSDSIIIDVERANLTHLPAPVLSSPPLG